MTNTLTFTFAKAWKSGRRSFRCLVLSQWSKPSSTKNTRSKGSDISTRCANTQSRSCPPILVSEFPQRCSYSRQGPRLTSELQNQARYDVFRQLLILLPGIKKYIGHTIAPTLCLRLDIVDHPRAVVKCEIEKRVTEWEKYLVYVFPAPAYPDSVRVFNMNRQGVEN